MSEQNVLSAQGLVKRFGGFRAVDGVSLALREGSIHALIGPNGAGKTTCFNLLTKFLSPDEGEIRYRGRDITSLAPEQIARLGIVRSFQISAVFLGLTVLQNMRVALMRQHGDGMRFWRSRAAWTASTRARWNCWPPSGWMTRPTPSPRCCPMAASARWRSP